ncbi:MAG: hypothetical protein DLM58_11585 [Pseudonocardiales bacterium]|nr:MAG: hypothetical protein DLM58_11585 [Pseudonocardiales bacterium]
MEPALPSRPDPDEPVNYDVGAFEQGSPVSRWALARYLVGRAVIESVSASLLIAALVVLALAGVIEWWVGSTFWAILVVLVALGILVMRAILRAVLRRLSGAEHFGPIEQRLNALVENTKSDVFGELRRVGLPSHIWTLPLLPFRFLGQERRRETVTKLRNFDVDRVVPKARVDELHLILRDTVGH